MSEVRMRTWLLVVSFFFVSSSARGQFTAVIDLGHPLSESDPSWSGEKSFGWTAIANVETDGVGMGKFFSDEHFGTHLDAPAHFAKKGWTVDRIPVDRLVAAGVCISIEARVQENEDYRLSLEDVKAFEAEHGRIPEGAVVLVATGWDKRWPDARRYMNERHGIKHFPGIAVEAASFLATKRKVAGIGIDTPSVDYGPSTEFETHSTTMPQNVYHVENAAHLTRLPAEGFTVVVAPINLKGGSGGPTRVFALLE